MWTPGLSDILPSTNKIQEVDAGKYPVCVLCGHYIFEDWSIDHAGKLCEYFQFLNRLPPDWARIERFNDTYTPNYIISILDGIGVLSSVWILNSYGERATMIFTKKHVVDAIDAYFNNDSYAGLTLEEFLQKMVGNDVT